MEHLRICTLERYFIKERGIIIPALAHHAAVYKLYLFRRTDRKGEVLEDQREVGGVAEGHVRERNGSLVRPVRRRLIRGCGLQRGPQTPADCRP